MQTEFTYLPILGLILHDNSLDMNALGKIA